MLTLSLLGVTVYVSVYMNEFVQNINFYVILSTYLLTTCNNKTLKIVRNERVKNKSRIFSNLLNEFENSIDSVSTSLKNQRQFLHVGEHSYRESFIVSNIFNK